MEAFDPNSFMNQLKLKEAFYLMSHGQEADPSTARQILAQILPKEDKNTLFLRFKKAALQVLSAKGEPEEILPMPGLAFRGETTSAFQVERVLGAHLITFLFSPNSEQTEIHLAVETKPKAPFRVKLKLDGDTIETIQDLQKEKMFDSPIQTETAPEVVFFQSNKEVGRFQLFLETE
ncbi:hypothetical protein EHQ58_07965 [Leptospira ognonensis]|uniref:Uncharacterized protein n=1 Tax=Leptospira ognonensis TaxID=2484945 RepID=A0A4R9K1S0_9LEPT|nr:hypothetical protein [Leptospira ognonensis]TGL59672.1 hypothetical protein EHQ58_07965 [Leptospira ognonensis]